MLIESGRPQKHDPKWRHINEKFISEHQAGTQWVLKVSTKKQRTCFLHVAGRKKGCQISPGKATQKEFHYPWALSAGFSFRVPVCSGWIKLVVWCFFLRGHGHPVCPQTRLATARSVSKHQSDASGHSWPEHGLHYVALSATHLSKHIISKHVFP